MSPENLPTLSVTDAIRLINQSLVLSIPMIVVEGEVSGYRLSQGRWVFFDVKDEESSLRCFTTLHNQNIEIEDGMMLRLTARPNLHNKYGFSLVVENMTPSGEGSLKRALELTKKKLEAEGLFDPVKKRPLPEYPEKIGLVTSDEAAAYSDILKILETRWPLAEVVLADSYVQGDKAPKSLISSIERLNKQKHLSDVIIVARGGGSLEDLMAFNDENVVRAVAASRVPTIVGVGHERDVSLAELAADMRATTPTNAAQLATPDGPMLKESIAKTPLRLIASFNQKLVETRYQLRSLSDSLAGHLRQLGSFLGVALKTLQAYDPTRVLGRGYAIVRDERGKTITSSKQLQVGDIISSKFKSGQAKSEVKDVE